MTNNTHDDRICEESRFLAHAPAGRNCLLTGMAGPGKTTLLKEFVKIGDFKLTDAQRGRVDSLLAESESLRLFVRENLEQHAYGDVTTSEITQGYAEFCADKGWNALPTAIVERTLPDLMLDVFHVTKSHDIERNGKKSNRGWRRVRLKAAPAFHLTEGE